MSPPLHPNESARLACLRSLGVLDTAPEPRFDDVVRIAQALTGCPTVIVSLVDECRHWYKAQIGMEGQSQPREATICQYVIAEDRPIILPDAAEDPVFREHPYVTGPFGLRFYAGFPIMVEGMAVGTLCVADTVPHRMEDARLEALAALARQTATLMESRRAEMRASVAEGRFAAFMDHAPALAFLKDPEGRMQYVNGPFESLFGLATGELLGKVDSEWLPPEVAAETMAHDGLVRTSGEPAEIVEVVPTPDGVARHWSVQKFPVAMPEGVWVGGMAIDVTEVREARRVAQAERDFSEAVLSNGGALIVVVDRAGRIVRFNAECERISGWSAEEACGQNYWNVVCTPEERDPMRAWFAGLTPGTFPFAHQRAWTCRSGERPMIEWRSTAILDEAGEVAFVVGTGIDVTIRREQERLVWKQRRALREANARLKRLATTDELTRIANRLAFRRRLTIELARAERTNTPLSLALVDVDRFKAFNDDLGHAAGDETLRRVAGLLKEASRDLDLVARYGGEEFVVLMPNTGRADATTVAERLRAAIEGAAWPVRAVTASFGVAILHPGESGESLLAEADRALYASKAAGRNRVTHADEASLPLAA